MNRLIIGATVLCLTVGCPTLQAMASSQIPITDSSTVATRRITVSQPQQIAQNNNTPLLIAGQDGAFLGVVSNDRYDDRSICNRYGTFGSPYSASSVLNKYAQYGGSYSDMGAYNPIATRPPIVVQNGQAIGFLTKNRRIKEGIDPDFLVLSVCGR